MHEIVKRDYEMTGRRVERSEALERYSDNPFKVELARDIPRANPSRSTRSASSPICAAADTRRARARSVPSS